VKSIGIPRKIDHLGRIVVPVEFRRLLGIHDGDELEIALDGDHLLLRKVDPACALCGAIADLQPFRDRQVCAGCIDELRST
jgi:transcriptional pleiotropic regulator of transition state genes